MLTVFQTLFSVKTTIWLRRDSDGFFHCFFKRLIAFTFCISVVVILMSPMNTNDVFADMSDQIDQAEMSGALLICGGGDLPDVIFKRFLERAGGSQARLVVIPTARVKTDSLDPTGIYAEWQVRGVESVAVLHTLSSQEANRDAFVEPLRQATGVWLTGGAQSRLAGIYVGTAVERELHALLARGGVIGGTSAGAAIQTRIMIARGNPDAEIEVGFGLLPDSVIDQHFLTRNRKQRLIRVVQEYPGLIGFGIDEGTALDVAEQRLHVLGDSSVTIILAASKTQSVQEIELQAGESINFMALQRAAQARAEATAPIKNPL